MEPLVLRVRLVSGDSMDVTYRHNGAAQAGDALEHVITTLSRDGGVLRCEHGDRLFVIYSRGVAAVEVGPRGAVL